MNKMKEYTTLLVKTIENLDESAVDRATEAFLHTYNKGGNIYFFGNGGSGATASHIAGDFLKGASYGLEKRFRTICLNDNMSALMAIANDIGYEDIFVEALKNYLKQDDLVIGISGSGNSENVVRAIQYAADKGITTLALSGYSGGKISRLAKISLHVAVDDMEIAEDMHMILFHIIKRELQSRLMGDAPSMGTVYDKRLKDES